MSGFSAAWLALREPADHRARAAGTGALAALRRHWELTGPEAALDLGTGTGSNHRWLAPRLPVGTRWTLVDHDAALLERAHAAALASSQGSDAGPASAAAASSSAPAPAPAPSLRVIDLARELDRLEFPARGLVTAAALLDLVSADWLAALAGRCRQAEVAVLFALTYDGRSTCKPVDAEDAVIVSLVNQHQRRDKGFGPALGPGAAAGAAFAFAEQGYRLLRVASDWQIGADEPELQAELLAGWAAAATEQAPDAAPRIAAWLARRRAHLARGRSRLRVGHEDLYGWLEPAGAH